MVGHMSVIHIAKSSIPAAPVRDRGYRQGVATATTTESQIPGGPWKADKFVLIQSSPANTENILLNYPGAAASGFVLEPGQSVQIPVDSTDAIGIVAASGTQTYRWSSL